MAGLSCLMCKVELLCILCSRLGTRHLRRIFFRGRAKNLQNSRYKVALFFYLVMQKARISENTD